MKAVILILNVTILFYVFHKCPIYTGYIPTDGICTVTTLPGSHRGVPSDVARPFPACFGRAALGLGRPGQSQALGAGYRMMVSPKSGP